MTLVVVLPSSTSTQIKLIHALTLKYNTCSNHASIKPLKNLQFVEVDVKLIARDCLLFISLAFTDHALWKDSMVKLLSGQSWSCDIDKPESTNGALLKVNSLEIIYLVPIKNPFPSNILNWIQLFIISILNQVP